MGRAYYALIDLGLRLGQISIPHVAVLAGRPSSPDQEKSAEYESRLRGIGRDRVYPGLDH